MGGRAVSAGTKGNKLLSPRKGSLQLLRKTERIEAVQKVRSEETHGHLRAQTVGKTNAECCAVVDLEYFKQNQNPSEFQTRPLLAASPLTLPHGAEAWPS